jgi:YrhK-like protein
MVGALCFALGAVPGYLELVGADADNSTFFVGSIFFTSAAFLQYVQTVNPSRAPTPGTGRRFRIFTVEPGRIDWWSSVVQLVGTVFFNISTYHALQASLSAAQINQLVWRPDAYGSICFLVASGLAWAEVGHRWISWRPGDLPWVIAALNLVGSIAFGVSAVADKIVGGEPRSLQLVNLGTFVGALAFFVGAALLLPERTREAAVVEGP